MSAYCKKLLVVFVESLVNSSKYEPARYCLDVNFSKKRDLFIVHHPDACSTYEYSHSRVSKNIHFRLSKGVGLHSNYGTYGLVRRLKSFQHSRRSPAMVLGPKISFISISPRGLLCLVNHQRRSKCNKTDLKNYKLEFVACIGGRLTHAIFWPLSAK